MKKLTLKLEDLAVESFDTARVGTKGGTVRGAELTQEATCAYTCGKTNCGSNCNSRDGWGSCDYESCSCPYTFDPSPIDSENSCVWACPEC
jgi:hypothetical protein